MYNEDNSVEAWIRTLFTDSCKHYICVTDGSF